MIFEKARTDEQDALSNDIAEAKRDYDNAVNRFNSARSDSMTDLAIFDMNTAMKRYCFIVETAKYADSSK